MTGRDVSAIVETFTHQELALMLAQIVERNYPDGLTIDRRGIGLGRDAIATVSEHQHSGHVVQIKVHEPERDTGYYLVYDGAYCQDGVLFWDQTKAHWRTSEHPESSARRDRTAIQAQRFIGPAIDSSPNAPKPALPWMPGQANWKPERVCYCDEPNAVEIPGAVPITAWILCKTCRGYIGPNA